MLFQFYNTKSAQKEPFQPLNPNSVKVYSCGPTVYNYAHIGNIRSFLFVDILRRGLKLAGYKLDQTMNITDIDDKIINESIKKGISVEEFTKPWTEAFFEDLKTLNVETLEHYPKATESIHDMVHIVHKLKENGLVYEKDGSLYYSIQRFPKYGALSRIDVTGMKSGARYDADEYEKDDVRDFVLWKTQKTKDEKAWESDLGVGRPGWHLECSAMIRKVYQSGVDIHTGGIDLLFPHHENELALSEGAYPNETFVGTWLHCEHLLVEGEKMSKSKGNFYTLRDIVAKGYQPKYIRYHLISSHYRSKLNFSLKTLNESKQAFDRIQSTLNRVLTKLSYEWPKIDASDISKLHSQIVSNKILSTLNEFESSIADDLNLPKALSSIFDFLREINSGLDLDSWSHQELNEIVYSFQIFDVILGILSFEKEEEKLDGIDKEKIESMIEARKLAKLNKDFATADQIRKNLLELEIQLLDHKDGTTTWKRNQ
jgi:cysteinyl-tRNA synthetase